MLQFVCPHWVGYLLLCPLRRLVHDPVRLLSPLVHSGMTVLEIGPAMGFFTMPMARMVGPEGRIVCVELQEKMLVSLSHRAARDGLAERIEARRCQPDSLGVSDLADRVDFVLAFAVVHEVPDASKLFAEVASTMKPGAGCFIAEPKVHVSEKAFERTLAHASGHGLVPVARPRIIGTHAAFVRRP